jgi:hypothetical protein
VAFLPCLPRATRPPARSGSINRLGLYGFGPLCDVQAEPVEVVVLSTNSNERNSGDPQSNLQGDPQIAKYRNEKLNRELIELLGELRVDQREVRRIYLLRTRVNRGKGLYKK